MNKQDNQGANQLQPPIANSMEPESLADLPLTAARAEGTKAGIEGGTSATAGEFPWQVSFLNISSDLHLKPLTPQGLSSNHNETTAEDAEGSDTAMAQLADLPVTAEQTQQTKGGPSRDHDKWIDLTPISQIVTKAGSNHNETVAEDAEDSAIAMAPLTDLPVAVEQAEEVSGGAIGMKCQNNLKQIGLAIH